MTNRFTGHPVGVAKDLAKAKARTRDDRERRCIESLLCGLTDEEFEGATRVEAVYHVGRNRSSDRLTNLTAHIGAQEGGRG